MDSSSKYIPYAWVMPLRGLYLQLGIEVVGLAGRKLRNGGNAESNEVSAGRRTDIPEFLQACWDMPGWCLGS